jgi:exonuclease III
VKLATFNVNGVNGRLSVLLRWLAEAAPDVVCLQELKTPQEKFPETAIREAGYGVVAAMIAGSPAIAARAISPSRSAGIEYSASLPANSRPSPEAKPS